MLESQRTHDRYARWAGAYRNAAVALLSLILGFSVLNLVLYSFPSLRTSEAVETPLTILGLDRLLPAYPGWTPEEIVRLHEESRVVFRYEPIVQFKIRPITGKYVNVSTHGFRHNAQAGAWPPDPEAFNVFVFGGSTTFGWLLPDRDTIVSGLQRSVASAGCRQPVVFYNFGQPSYMSTQEALLFQSLVTDGNGPDLAIFVDGFNDFFYRGEMAFSNALRQIMDRSDLQYRLGPVVDLPLYQLARRLRARFMPPSTVLDLETEDRLTRAVIAQWVRNQQFIEGIGVQHKVNTVFVWQPVPSFKYDLNYHFLYRDRPFAPGERVPYEDIGRSYVRMAEMRSALESRSNFLWLADIQANRRENLYVDRVHYSAKFSQEIADEILKFLRGRGLLPCSN